MLPDILIISTLKQKQKPLDDISEAFKRCFNPSNAMNALYASGQLFNKKLTKMQQCTCISILLIHLGIKSKRTGSAPALKSESAIGGSINEILAFHNLLPVLTSVKPISSDKLSATRSNALSASESCASKSSMVSVSGSGFHSLLLLI